MLRTIQAALAALLFVAVPAAAISETKASRDEAVSMVERTVEHFQANGLDATAEAVMNQSNAAFFDRDLYVFIFDMDGTVVAHGAKPPLVGKSLLGLRDQNGHLFVQSMVDGVRESPEAWVDYKWPNPTTNAIESKTSYVVRLGDGHFAGVGFYTE